MALLDEVKKSSKTSTSSSKKSQVKEQPAGGHWNQKVENREVEEVDFWLHKRHFFSVYWKESSGACAGCFEKKTTSAVHGVDCGVRPTFWKFKNDSRTLSTDLLYSGWGYIQNRRCHFTNLSAVVDQKGEEERGANWTELLASAT